jgi:hypothetical protein
MNGLTKLAAILVLTLIAGCYSGTILEYDGLKPAQITLPANVKSMVVVARCDLDSTYKAAFLSAGRKIDFKRDSLLNKQAVIGCSDALVESPKLSLFNPTIKRTNLGSQSDPTAKIPWHIITLVGGDPQQDAILVLESGSVRDTIRSVVQDEWLNSFEYVTEIKTFWRLYQLGNFQSREFQFTDTVAFDIESPSGLISSSERKLEYLKVALYEAGVKSAKRLAPYWITVQRYFFTMGPLDFLTGAEYLREGKWMEAAEVYRPFTESPKKTIAAKAAFNMAITSEMGGNIPAALEWLKTAENHGMLQYYVDDYLSKLLPRKIEIDKLNEQMR